MEIEFIELYSIKGKHFIKSKILSFNNNNSSNNNLYGLFSNTECRMNYEKIPIIGVAQKFHGLEWGADIETINNNETNEVIFKSGIYVDEFNFMRDMFNFTTINIQGTGFTRAFTNSVIIGMGNQLENGEADISITASEMTMLRFEHLAFLHPTIQEDLFLYFKQLPTNYLRNMYISTFKSEIWKAIILSIILFIIGIITIAKFNQKFLHLPSIDQHFPNDSYLWAIAIFCQQGWYYSPQAIPFKVIMLCGLFVALVIYAAFSASLVSLLSVTVVPIKSLDDAILHGFQLFGEIHTVSARYVLNVSTNT